MGGKGNYRAAWHDYQGRGIYHLTLRQREGGEAFGRLEGGPENARVVASEVGVAIKRALRELPEIHPALHLFQYALMPDHLHLLLSVESPLDEILGRKIAALKVRINNYAEREQIFAKGFNDQILTPARSLDAVYRYLRENPRKLAVRRQHPEYFRRVNRISIGEMEFAAYGNMYLLDNPFKEQVIVHRRDSAEERERAEGRWLHTVANGGVMVSPFISPAEKAIRRKAEELEGKIILIQNEGFGERGKPGAHDFEQCEQGRLLILTPLEADFPRELSRACCLRMNEAARRLAELSCGKGLPR